jgi:hypothetical protein
MLLGTLKRRGGRAALWLVVGLLIGGAAGAGTVYFLKQGKRGVSGGPRLGDAEELKFVPGEATAFVHIRLRGLYDSEALAEVRKIVDAAGPQAKAALDDSFVPAPSTLDRLTLVFIKIPPAPPTKGKAAPPPPKVGGPLGAIGDILPANLGSDTKVVALLAFSAPFEADKVTKAHTKNAVAKKIGDREYFDDADAGFALHYPSTTTMAIGDSDAVRNYLVRLNAGPAGPLAKPIEHAQKGGWHVVAAVNVSQLGIAAGKFDELPGDNQNVVKHAQTVLKAESLMIGAALTDEGAKVEIRAKYKDDAAATESEAALRELAKFARTKLAEPKKQMEKALKDPPDAKKPRPITDLPEAVGGFLGVGSINALSDWLADPPLKTNGNEVVLTPRVPSMPALYAAAAAGAGAFLFGASEKFGAVGAPIAPEPPAKAPGKGPPGKGPVGNAPPDKAPGLAERQKDATNLKQIALGLHNHEAANGAFPAPDGVTAANAKGGLSWRVHLLAHIELPETQELAKEFKMDEPWDSEHNKKLIDKMPAVFASPLATDPVGRTRYKALVGTGAAFEPGKWLKVSGFVDGTSNTIVVVGGGEPVIWTKPDDIEVKADLAPAVLALPGQNGCNVCLGDGSVRWADLARLDPKKLKALVTRAGEEMIDFDW